MSASVGGCGGRLWIGFGAWVDSAVDSLDSHRNPPKPGPVCPKSLKLSLNPARLSQTGFQVDSPVKYPNARKLPRQAPPYTDCAQEEPWEGDGPTQALHLTTGRSDIRVV